jgi:hypothetical protein
MPRVRFVKTGPHVNDGKALLVLIDRSRRSQKGHAVKDRKAKAEHITYCYIGYLLPIRQKAGKGKARTVDIQREELQTELALP